MLISVFHVEMKNRWFDAIFYPYIHMIHFFCCILCGPVGGISEETAFCMNYVQFLKITVLVYDKCDIINDKKLIRK